MSTSSSNARPNVLLVMTDQHIAAAMGCEGHPQAITPNMDRLAAKGVRFSRAYTQNPICTPSRMSILTGQYCHNHGYYGLSGPTPPRLPSVMDHFKAAGYRTGLFGKLHLPNDPTWWLEDVVDTYDEYARNYQYGNRYREFARDGGFEDEVDYGMIPDIAGKQQNEARASKLTFRQSVEGFTNTRAMEFIDDAGDEPWIAQVSYFRPHQCYTPSQEFWDQYADDIELPFGCLDEWPDRPPHFRAMSKRGQDQPGQYEPKNPVERARRVWRGYLACVTMCDFALGEMLDHLEARGLADNTVVVYYADHGAYSGMYGVPEKAPGICSEAVCRIPYIWYAPGVTKAGHVADAFAENVDITPTVTALAGLDPMDTVDGKDITALLRGDDAPVRDVSVTENPWSKGVRWDDWRLVHYQPGTFGGEDVGELYDLSADPLETRNLYRDPTYADTVSYGRRLLLEWLIRTTRVTTCNPAMSRFTDHPDWPPTYQPAGDGKEPNWAGPAMRAARNSHNYI